jgi:hydroxypyruvate isomerase
MSHDRRTFLAASAALAGTVFSALSVADAHQQKQNKLLTDTDSQIGKTPHTKFAVNIEMWFRQLPFLDRIRAAAALGFPGYEFWPYEPQLERLDEIRKLNEQLGLVATQFTAWGFKPGMNDPKNHDAFVRKMEEACQVAKRLDCKLMTVVAGDDIPGMSQPQMHENVIQALKRAAPICEEQKITMILEPMNIRVDHKGHCLYGSRDALRICSEVNSPAVKINWDLYHMQISEGDLCGHLKEGFAAGHIGYLQLADHPGRNEPGTGEIHYNRVLQQAHDLGYRGFVGLECVPKRDELSAAKAVARADQW